MVGAERFPEHIRFKSLKAPRSLRGCAPFANPPTSKTSIGCSRSSRVKVPDAEPDAAPDRDSSLIC